MCGIAGAFNFSPRRLAPDRALEVLRNRGPDGRGVMSDKGVVLLHTRLSIIDLSEHASQPMISACGRYIIVFNGEIYNYRELRRDIEGSYAFGSISDTEVILAYYAKFGPKALEFLRGMFALAIWDKEKEELFVARDRLGVKPLYFTTLGKGFAFSSRPDALCALLPELKPAIDKQALRYFLEAGYVPAPHSIYQGVQKLEPGHYLVVSNQGVNKVRYWSLDHVGVDESLSAAREEALLDELDALIDESVRLRMVSDVPIGAFLSGGIDSSLVAAYMSRHAADRIKTFTIGFEDPSFDESGFAASVAAHLGTDHTCERLAVDDLLELMPTFVKQYDEPFFDYSAFPVMAVSRLARRSVTVSLSGDGGDEAFGGYHYYRMMAGLERAHHFPMVLRKSAAAALRVAPNQRLRWLGHVISAEGAATAYAFMRGVIKDASDLMQPSLRLETQSLSQLFARRAEALPQGLPYSEIGMRLDLAFTLPDDYLQKVDVGSMAFSLEARDPLLDHTIIEWAAKLPAAWKLRAGTNKYLLRKLAYRYIPREILDRPKMGFGVPMARWLRGGMRDWGESLLADDDALEALGLDAAVVRALWRSHQSGQVQAHTALWSALVALQFYRTRLQSA